MNQECGKSFENNMLSLNDSLFEQVDLDDIENSIEMKTSNKIKMSPTANSFPPLTFNAKEFLQSDPRENCSKENNKRVNTDPCESQSKIIKFESRDEQEAAKNDGIVYQMTQFKSSEYRDEISKIFNKLEDSICQPDGCISKKKENNEWLNDTFLSNILLDDFTQPTTTSNFTDVINKALKNNATKAVPSPNLVNRTIINAQEQDCKMLGPFYGLPKKVMDLIKLYKGIDELYGWQDECLKLDAVKERRNLIYSLPTSGGKTLVAEILMLKEIIYRKHNVIFVLPYVALVQEKIWALSPFAVALDFFIEEYAGGKGVFPPKKRRYKNSLYIATNEKAMALVNSLVEQNRLKELGLIVVDELHLIGEDQRGPTLEALLTKLIFLNEDIQIVGMSATIGNLKEICTFLKADVYTRDFRPVELTEYVKCENNLLKINYSSKDENFFEFVKSDDFSYNSYLAGKDPDRLGGLVMEVVPNGSVLIFCPTKSSCENVTALLSHVLNRTNLRQHRSQEKLQLLQSLKNESETICPILENSVPFGFAYHHSGLTSEERRLMEDAYRLGILSVICCTSTLAAGVNLPARRVIIRKPYIAKDFITLSRYKQMVGRAGRAGLGEMGESILICNKEDVAQVKELLMAPMDEVLSKMNQDNCKCVRHLFLSCISLNTADTRTKLEKVLNTTLLAVQQDRLNVDIKSLTKKVISDIYKLGAVVVPKQVQSNNNTQLSLGDISINMNSSLNISKIIPSNEGYFKENPGDGPDKKISIQSKTKLVVSKLGNASIKGGLDLHIVHMLYEDLLSAQESLVLLDSLHLLYLVTPYSLAEQIKPMRNHYHHILMNLEKREKKTATILGINDFCIMRMFSNLPIKSVPERVLNRFYMSLMLYDLWKETSVVQVSEKYQINRGIVQNLMTSASTFAANVVRFCEELEEFWPFAHLLRGMSNRLAHCCCNELIPLMELPAVKQSRAKQLYKAGFKNLQSIAKADPKDLIEISEFMSTKVANQLIAAAKLLLLEKVESLREKAEDVLDGIQSPKMIFNQNAFH